MDINQALTALPREKRARAMRIIEEVENGPFDAAFKRRGKRLSVQRQIISIPLGYKWRLLFVETDNVVRFGEAFGHHEYEALIERRKPGKIQTKYVQLKNGTANPSRPPFKAPKDLPPPSTQDLLDEVHEEQAAEKDATGGITINGKNATMEHPIEPLPPETEPPREITPPHERRSMQQRLLTYIQAKEPGWTANRSKFAEGMGVKDTETANLVQALQKMCMVGGLVRSGLSRATVYTVQAAARELRIVNGQVQSMIDALAPPSGQVVGRSEPIPLARHEPRVIKRGAKQLIDEIIRDLGELEAHLKPSLEDFTLDQLMEEMHRRIKQRGP